MPDIVKKSSEGFVAFFLPYAALEFIFTIVAFAVVALIYVFIPLSDGILRIITIVISVVVMFIVSASVGRETASAISGGIIALIYTLVRYIISISFGFVPFLSIKTPFVIATGFLIGIMGGILGSSTRPRRRRKYRY
ncbi:MAG: TIGR04086 family membrane protein [Bacillota bacterium]|nr:TIGR04086 family membrane protein [Bacillota bacterium]